MPGLSDQPGLAAPRLPVQALRLGRFDGGGLFSDARRPPPKPVRYH